MTLFLAYFGIFNAYWTIFIRFMIKYWTINISIWSHCIPIGQRLEKLGYLSFQQMFHRYGSDDYYRRVFSKLTKSDFSFHFIFFFWFQKLKSDDSMMTKYYGSSKILLKKLGNWGDQQCDQICQNLADIEQSLSIFSFLGKNFCIYLPLKLPLLWLIFLLLVSGQIWHK